MELELFFLFGLDGESELNGKKFVILIKMDNMCVYNCLDLFYLEVVVSRYMVIFLLLLVKN